MKQYVEEGKGPKGGREERFVNYRKRKFLKEGIFKRRGSLRKVFWRGLKKAVRGGWNEVELIKLVIK